MIRAASPVALTMCAVFMACSTTGCGRQLSRNGEETRAVGANLYERGEQEVVERSQLREHAVRVDDLWSPGSSKAQYLVDDRVFDAVEPLLDYLRALDPARLKDGLLLVHASKVERQGDKQDLERLCSFAEERNIDLFVMNPSSYHLPNEGPVLWLVKSVSSTQPEEERVKTDRD